MKLKVVVLTLSSVLAITLLTPSNQVESAKLGKKSCSYTHRDAKDGVLSGPRQHMFYTEIADTLPCPEPQELISHAINDTFNWEANEGSTTVYMGLTDGRNSEDCEVTVTITAVPGEPVFGPL